MNFLTPEFFDGLIILNIIIGAMLAARQLRKDFARPPKQQLRENSLDKEDTREIKTEKDFAEKTPEYIESD